MVGGPGDASLTSLLARLIGAVLLSLFVNQKMVFFIARINREDMTLLRDLMGDKKVTPVIDRTYRLSETAEAFRYMEEGHARGKVVITLEQKNET